MLNSWPKGTEPSLARGVPLPIRHGAPAGLPIPLHPHIWGHLRPDHRLAAGDFRQPGGRTGPDGDEQPYFRPGGGRHDLRVVAALPALRLHHHPAEPHRPGPRPKPGPALLISRQPPRQLAGQTITASPLPARGLYLDVARPLDPSKLAVAIPTFLSRGIHWYKRQLCPLNRYK